MADTAAVIAYNFYEHKNVEKLMEEAKAEKIEVKVVETKEGVTTYDVGGAWTAVLYTPSGKKPAVTIRPILPA
jgi:hypothetical protein